MTFTSKNKKVASVTAKGVIKAVKAGSTKIEVKVSYIPKSSNKVTKKTVRCTVKVTNPEDTTDVAPDLTVQATAHRFRPLQEIAGKSQWVQQ